MSRLQTRFDELKQQNRAALVTFITAGDPDYATSLAILKGLPAAGADVIELGMPFTDPMADGRRSSWPTSAPWPPSRTWRRRCRWFANSVRRTGPRQSC